MRNGRWQKIQGVAFDMDGLMFDTERLSLAAWDKAASLMGVSVPEDVVFRTLGLNAENTRRVMLGALGAGFDYDGLRELRLEYIYGHIDRFGMPVKEGLAELLAFLRSRGYKMTVATSTDRDRTLYYLDRAGIGSYFGDIVCGDMVERGKPEPDIYLKASEVMRLDPGECVALEDSPAGIKAARDAGMLPVMIPDLVPPDDSIKELLYAIVPSLSGVIPLLESARRAFA